MKWSGAIRKLTAGTRRLEANYASNYPLAKLFNLRPVFHWLIIGIWQKKKFLPNLRLSVSGKAIMLRVSPVAVNNLQISPELMQELEIAGELEPSLALLAVNGINELPVYSSFSFRQRTGLPEPSHSWLPSDRFAAILVVDRLAIGGGEKYMSDLLETISKNNPSQVLVISTDSAHKRSGLRSPKNSAWLDNCMMVSWDANEGFPDDPDVFARYLRVLNPSRLFVCNSDLGYRTLLKYHLGLQNSHRLYAVFFSFGSRSALTYAKKYARDLVSKVRFVSDNAKIQDELALLFPTFEPSRSIVLRNRIKAADSVAFEEVLRNRSNKTRHAKSFLWIGRIEPFKDVQVLIELCAMRPTDTFSIYGPIQDPVLFARLRKRNNVTYLGMWKPSDLKPEDFDGLIFTSQFEGMPNVPIEIAQLGIPLFVSDVGGVRETFGDESCYLVNRKASVSETASMFNIAILEYFELDLMTREKRLRNAFQRVETIHSDGGFQSSIVTNFGVGLL